MAIESDSELQGYAWEGDFWLAWLRRIPFVQSSPAKGCVFYASGSGLFVCDVDEWLDKPGQADTFAPTGIGAALTHEAGHLAGGGPAPAR